MKSELRCNTSRLRYLPLLLAILLTISVFFLFGGRKSGMFIDEIYTYALSNSSYAPFLIDLKDGEMVGKVFSRGELMDYVSVCDGEGFDFASVYYNQVNDVHPPLHYWLTNIVSTLFPNTFSKWTGLGLNLLLYLLTLLVLYKTVRRLGGGQCVSVATALLYSLSVIGLSTAMMIRMYMLLTLLTALLALLVLELTEKFSLRSCLLISLTLCLGLMTQYYFVFYAFFLCASYVIYALISKQYKALAVFIPCALVGAFSLLVLFPACLTHLFSGKLVSGDSAVENLKNLAQYPIRLKTFISFATHGMKAAIYVGLLSLVAFAILFKKIKTKGFKLNALVILVPSFPVYILVALMSPVDEPRYVYNLIPIFCLCVAWLLCLLEQTLPKTKRAELIRLTALGLITAIALWEARCAPPDYLYPEYKEYDALIAAHSDEPCVYFSDNRFEAITQDLIQLMGFEEFYVTDEANLSSAISYVDGAEEFVAYVDISEFWSSGYNADKILADIADCSDYDRAELLYQNGLSATYVISK